MDRLDDINIRSYSTLPSPARIKQDLPLSERAANVTADARRTIERIMHRELRRHLMIVGPCSIHSTEDALEYARRLKALATRVADRILIVMRAYVEKPRTTVGWKGLIYDPDLDDTCDIERGLHVARRLMLDIAESGLPLATEVLDPVMPQYLSDTVAWAAIGARTTESQTHRQLVSGLSMPTGFKNPTDGSVRVAIEAVQTAAAPHSFLGVTAEGRSGLFRTAGNPYCHVVLRGGAAGPNYGGEHIAYARVLMGKMGIAPNIVIDCSHANSGKAAKRQLEVMRDVIGQIVSGEDAIIGTMLESNLLPGRQQVDRAENLQSGVSVTDECLGWEETETAILEAYERLGALEGEQ